MNNAQQALRLAQYAKNDPTLIPNHLPHVPCDLRREIADLTTCIAAYEGIEDRDGTVSQWKKERQAAREALAVYQPFLDKLKEAWTMEHYRLEPTNGKPALEFTGELLGETDGASKGLSAYIDLELYKTQSGKFVVYKIGINTKPGSDVRRDYTIYDSLDDLKERVHWSIVTSELFNNAGLSLPTQSI